MIFPSNLGQPFNSLLVKRGNFNKFLRDKKANVAIKARKDNTSIKLMVKVYKPPIFG